MAVESPRAAGALLVALLLFFTVGCHTAGLTVTPAEAGLNTNDLVDLPAQSEADELSDVRDLYAYAGRLKRHPTPEQLARRRSVLCLSGGGSYGAYVAGVLCGWTAGGDRPGCNGRPNFEVVTGISTGALAAPFAFLGPQYDDTLRKFYTTVEQKNIFTFRPVRGLFTIALADNAPLAETVDELLTPQLLAEVAAEHRKGRRLYIGTTELEGRRLVFWDVGEIACRGTPADRELIKQVLVGSSAIPGFFPPSRIPVTVDGRTYVESHGDGGTSASIFFRPPFVPEGQRTPEALDLAGVDLYMIVAGKLYADAEPLRKRSLTLAGSSVSTVIYAQTRGDLQRMFLVSLLTGMNYHLAAIPPEFPAPTSSTAFEPGPMTAMFDEGFRLAAAGQAWRSSPPGVEPGESPLGRQGTDLTFLRRGPSRVVGRTPRLASLPAPLSLAPGPMPIPAVPGNTEK